MSISRTAAGDTSVAQIVHSMHCSSHACKRILTLSSARKEEVVSGSWLPADSASSSQGESQRFLDGLSFCRRRFMPRRVGACFMAALIKLVVACFLAPLLNLYQHSVSHRRSTQLA